MISQLATVAQCTVPSTIDGVAVALSLSKLLISDNISVRVSSPVTS